MKKYKIEIKQSEIFIIDVYAKNETEAKEIAKDHFNGGDYYETGDIYTDFQNIYDVTYTDDCFSAVNNTNS